MKNNQGIQEGLEDYVSILAADSFNCINDRHGFLFDTEQTLSHRHEQLTVL